MKKTEIEKLEKRFAQWKKWRWLALGVGLLDLASVYAFGFKGIIIGEYSESIFAANKIDLFKQYGTNSFLCGAQFGLIFSLIIFGALYYRQQGRLLSEIKRKFNT